MKLLITGSHGFLGKHMVSSFRKLPNVKIVPFERKNNYVQSVSYIKKYLTGVHCVIHLAGVNRDSTINLHEGNASFTLVLLEAIRLYAPNAKIIYASSSQVNDEHSFYGITKQYCETLIRWYSQTYGMKAIIFRFPNIYGPFCKPFYNSVIATFIYLIMHKKKILVHGDGTQKRDFLYVTDVVDAVRKAVFYNSKKKISEYNVCSGSLVSLKKVIKILYQISPQPVVCRYSKVLKEAQIPQASYNTAKADFGWKPSISLAEGCRKIFEEEYGVSPKNNIR